MGSRKRNKSVAHTKLPDPTVQFVAAAPAMATHTNGSNSDARINSQPRRSQKQLDSDRFLISFFYVFGMKVKDFLRKKLELKCLELNLILAITIMTVLLLITNWPRFMNDAMSVPWYGYVLLIVFLSLLLAKRRASKV